MYIILCETRVRYPSVYYNSNKVLSLDSPVLFIFLFFQMLIQNRNNIIKEEMNEIIIMRNVTLHLIPIVIRPVKCSGNYIMCIRRLGGAMR